MSVSYFVRYDIQVADVAAFVRRYREVHVPLVARWPGLRSMTLHTPLEWQDTAPVNKGRAVLLAQLEFDTQADLERAFASRERAEARADFKRFMTFEGSVTHQAMNTEEVWRKA
jgi:uncharacterized protein (TIGR02118 family)